MLRDADDGGARIDVVIELRVAGAVSDRWTWSGSERDRDHAAANFALACFREALWALADTVAPTDAAATVQLWDATAGAPLFEPGGRYLLTQAYTNQCVGMEMLGVAACGSHVPAVVLCAARFAARHGLDADDAMGIVDTVEALRVSEAQFHAARALYARNRGILNVDGLAAFLAAQHMPDDGTFWGGGVNGAAAGFIYSSEARAPFGHLAAFDIRTLTDMLGIEDDDEYSRWERRRDVLALHMGHHGTRRAARRAFADAPVMQLLLGLHDLAPAHRERPLRAYNSVLGAVVAFL